MVVSWFSNSELQTVGDRFPGRENVNLLFSSDIVNHLLKTSMERGRKPNFVILNAWIAGGGVRKRYFLGPAEKACFVFLALFKLYSIPGVTQENLKPTFLYPISSFHWFILETKNWRLRLLDSPSVPFSLNWTRNTKDEISAGL